MPLSTILRQEASRCIRVDDRTRTGDSQIHNLEQPLPITPTPLGLQHIDASACRPACCPDLDLLVSHWSELSDPIKAGITATHVGRRSSSRSLIDCPTSSPTPPRRLSGDGLHTSGVRRQSTPEHLLLFVWLQQTGTPLSIMDKGSIQGAAFAFIAPAAHFSCNRPPASTPRAPLVQRS
jgi:hypothetical protein